MSYNGSGVFERLYSWVTDRDNSINIDSTRMDAEMDGMASGLSNCITRDGQSTVTADIPMNNFTFTGLAAAASNTSPAQAEQVQSNMIFAAAGGTTSALTLGLTPAFSGTLVDGMRIGFKNIASNNVSGVTLKVDSQSAKNIVYEDGNNLASDELLANRRYEVIYDQSAGKFILEDRYCRSVMARGRLSTLVTLNSTTNNTAVLIPMGTSVLNHRCTLTADSWQVPKSGKYIVSGRIGITSVQSGLKVGLNLSVADGGGLKYQEMVDSVLSSGTAEYYQCSGSVTYDLVAGDKVYMTFMTYDSPDPGTVSVTISPSSGPTPSGSGLSVTYIGR